MTEPRAGVVRALVGQLPVSMSVSAMAHGLAACAVGVLVSARPAPPRAPLAPLLLTVSVMQPPPAPVPVDIERPRLPSTAPRAVAPVTPAHPAPARPVAAAPTPAAAPAPVLDAPLAAEGPALAAAPPSATIAPVAVAPSPVPAVEASPQGSAHAAPGPMVDVGEYLSGVRDRVGRHRRYPPMALEMQLEGTVEVRVIVNPDGTLAAPPALDESCGHEMLDEEALRIVARAAPFPPLTGHREPVRLRVPVHFHID